MVFAGIDSSDGVGGIVPAAVAAHLGLPFLSYAAKIEPDMAAGRSASGGSARPATTCSRRRCPRCHRRHAGARRAALPVAQGDHGGARTRRSSRKSLARSRAGPGDRTRRRGRHDGRPRQQAAAGPRPRRRSSAGPRPRAPPASSTSSPSGGSSDGRAVGRRRTRPRRRPRADQHRGRDARPRPGRVERPRASSASSSRPTRRPAAEELATYLPVVWAITEPAAAEHAWSAVAAGHIAALSPASRAARRDLRRRRRRRARPGRRRLGPDRPRRPGQRHRGQPGRTPARRSR